MAAQAALDIKGQDMAAHIQSSPPLILCNALGNKTHLCMLVGKHGIEEWAGDARQCSQGAIASSVPSVALRVSRAKMQRFNLQRSRLTNIQVRCFCDASLLIQAEYSLPKQ